MDAFLHSLEHRTIHAEYDGSVAYIEEPAPDRNKGDDALAPVLVTLTAADLKSIVQMCLNTFLTTSDADEATEAKRLINLLAPTCARPSTRPFDPRPYTE